MTREEIAEINPEAVILTGYDNAIIGMGYRMGINEVVVYDVDLIIQTLIEDGMTDEEALDFYGYNIENRWMGDNTPIYLKRFE